MRHQAVEPLNVDVAGDRLVITIGIGELPRPRGSARGSAEPAPAAALDRAGYAQVLAKALASPRADGRTPVQTMLDAVASDVAAGGARHDGGRAAGSFDEASEVVRRLDSENPARGIRNGILIASLLWILLIAIGWMALR